MSNPPPEYDQAVQDNESHDSVDQEKNGIENQAFDGEQVVREDAPLQKAAAAATLVGAGEDEPTLPRINEAIEEVVDDNKSDNDNVGKVKEDVDEEERVVQAAESPETTAQSNFVEEETEPKVESESEEELNNEPKEMEQIANQTAIEAITEENFKNPESGGELSSEDDETEAKPPVQKLEEAKEDVVDSDQEASKAEGKSKVDDSDQEASKAEVETRIETEEVGSVQEEQGLTQTEEIIESADNDVPSSDEKPSEPKNELMEELAMKLSEKNPDQEEQHQKDNDSS